MLFERITGYGRSKTRWRASLYYIKICMHKAVYYNLLLLLHHAHKHNIVFLSLHGSDPILKVQLTVESKLAITMRFQGEGEGEAGRKVTCDVDMALQDERWYHASMSVHPNKPMQVFINGVQIKYYCVENVSNAQMLHDTVLVIFYLV